MKTYKLYNMKAIIRLASVICLLAVGIGNVWGYTVTFSTGSGNPTVDAVAEASNNAGITLPAGVTPVADGWVFVGWATASCSESTKAPVLYLAGTEEYKPGANATMYAVYRKYTSGTSSVTFNAANISNLTAHPVYSRDWTDNTAGIDLYLSAGQRYTGGTPNTWTVTSSSSDWNFAMITAYRKIKQIDVEISGTSYKIDDGDDGVLSDNDDEENEKYAMTASSPTAVSPYTQTITYTGNVSGDVTQVWMYSTTSQQIRAKTIEVTYYNAKFSSEPCDNIVSLSYNSAGSSNVSAMTFSTTSVATCSSTAGDREVTITVTPSTGYLFKSGDELTWTKSSGTIPSDPTKVSGPTLSAGKYVFVYRFAQNDNGAGTFAATSSTYTNYRTICCTELGDIDGDVNITTDGCDPGEIKVTWKMEATTGIASQTLKVYDENADEVTAKRITSITPSTSNQTKTISGLDPCKEYMVTIENVSSGGVYCSAGAPWTSDVVTTLGYTYTVNATNCQLKSTSDPVPSDMCEGDVLVYYEATGGSTLPDAITVTNAGDEDEGWTWDSSTGELMIDASAVTGDVTVTIFASCPGFSFHYGNDGDDASLWTIACFEKVKPLDATDHEWKLEDFTIPSKTDFYVGYQGSFKGSDNLGTGGASSATKAWTSTPTYSTDHWDGAMILAPNDGYTYGSYAVGQATGATGTITIYDNSNSDNLFAEFEPDGYGISYSTSSYAFGDATSHVRETEVVTLPNVSTTYAIGLATATEGTFVKCAHSKSSDEAISAMGVSNKINGKKRILFNPVKSSDDYTTSNAKIAIWDATNSAFYDFMTDTDDDGILEGEVPTTCVKINIVRLNSNTTKSELTNSASTYAAAWAKKWNQSSDITLGDLLEQVNFDGWCSGDGCKESMTTTAIHPTTGQTGKFRMIDTDKNQNWNVRFVPYYKLSYDANGGSGSTTATTRDSESSTETVTVAANSFTAPTGYSFAGWATSDSRADAGTVDYAAGDSYTLNGDATLYAVWSANTISLTLSKNNSDASGSSDGSASVKYDGTALTSISHASRTGYSIEGYYGESGCTTKVLKDDGTFADDDVSGFIDGGKWNNATSPTTLYAKWTANSYTVTLDNNNATSGSQQTVSATYASSMPLTTTSAASVAALSRTGYTFTGWWDAAEGGNQYYSYDGSSIASERNWDKTSATTLKAQWSVNSYTLTWSWNGGSTSATSGDDYTASGSVAYGTTLVYPDDATMSKTGYTFTGWSSTPSTMPATPTTITAQWSINDYNIAVVANENVTITATPASGDAIAEGSNADVNYNKTITLNYSSLGSGLTWGGWKVYKADAPGTTVAVSGTGNGATFTMPAYAVKVEAFIYSAGIAWCDPEIEFDGDIHLTSAKDIYVHSTEGAGNLLNIASKDLGSATSMEIAYLDADDSDAEKDKDESLFRLYNSTASAAIDASSSTIDVSASRTFNTDYSIRYTPDDDGVINNYKLQLKLFKGEKELKTVTKAIYGRSLPDEFVITAKSGGTWYALPNTLAGTSDKQGVITPIEITVDDATTPTKASNPDEATIYGATGRYTATNINGIRFTNDGSHYIQISTSSDNYKMWLSSSGGTNVQDWYLKSSDFGAYEVFMDPIGSSTETRRIELYNSSGVKMGHHGERTGTGNVYILPIEYTVTYDGNGADDGDVPTDGTKYKYNASVTVLGNTGDLEKDGYTFLGWNTQADGNGTDYAADATFNITAGVTLYAKWQNDEWKDKYTFHYGDNSTGTWTVVPFTQVGETEEWTISNFTIPDPSTYPDFYVGYEGWFVSSDLGSNHSRSRISTWVEEYNTTYHWGYMRTYPGYVKLSDGSTKTAEGAVGTLHIKTDMYYPNVELGFEPSGYGLTIYNGSTSRTVELKSLPNPVVFETDLFDGTELAALTAAEVGASATYKVSLKTASGYVDSYQSTEWDVDDLNAKKLSYDTDITANKNGRFQVWRDVANYDKENFGLRYTPLVNRATALGYQNWSSVKTWTLGHLPRINEGVLIDDNNRINVDIANAVAKYVRIGEGTSTISNLTITPTGALLVAEDILAKQKDDESYGPTDEFDLVIESDNTGNGALIVGSKSTDTEAGYHFYSRSFSYNDYGYINQYIGIPFASMKSYQFYDAYLFSYDDEKDEWKGGVSDMNPFMAYNLIQLTNGYNAFYLYGNLNLPGLGTSASDNIVLECTTRPDEFVEEEGKTKTDHLFANSWTAPLDMSAFETSDFVNLEAQIQIFNAGSASKKEGRPSGLDENAGNYTAVTIDDEETPFIPGTSAFLVKTKDCPAGTPATLTLNYNKHVYAPALARLTAGKGISTTPTFAPRRGRKGSAFTKLNIVVYGDSAFADKLRIREREDFTNDFDNGWEASKTFGLDEAPQLYAISGARNLTVAAVPDVEGMIIGFRKGTKEDTYTLAFDYDGNKELYLNDLKEQTSTLISSDNEYTFTSSADDAAARFIISANPIVQVTTGMEEVVSEGLPATGTYKFIMNDKLYIYRDGVLYDATGKRVK